MSRTLIDGITAFGALAVIFWLGLAYWVNKDARLRIRRPLAVVTATLLGLVPCVGPLVYLLIRPAETRDQIRSRNAGLAALEAHLAQTRPACPTCSTAVESTFLVCPVCVTRLRESCPTCSAPLERLWQMCPYCETPIEAEVDLDAALLRATRSAPVRNLAGEAAPQFADS